LGGALAALLFATSGCGIFHDRCPDDRPGLFGRLRGQGPTEFVMPADCCPPNGTAGGPFLGAPAPAAPNVILPQPPPSIPPAGIQEGSPAQPMPYDPKMNNRPSGNQPPVGLKTVRN
jgi:hypothetical protein